jgi:hypothetical protein
VTRFSAKLLFQYRVARPDREIRRRWCEERTITFDERSPRRAIAYAAKIGRNATFTFRNQHDNTVSFEFIGIEDMISLGPECETGEVWYDVFQLLVPDERRDQHVRSEKELLQRLLGDTSRSRRTQPRSRRKANQTHNFRKKSMEPSHPPTPPDRQTGSK